MLHFKSDLLEDEATSVADLAQLDEIQAKISKVNGVVEIDNQFPIASPDELDSDNVTGDTHTNLPDAQSHHRHVSLKGSCPTRWNSTLVMMESIVDLYKAVENTLKRIGHVELCLTSGEQDLLKSLCAFLKGFEKFTELVSSSSVPTLSMIPLMKLQIKKMCNFEPGDEDAVRSVKELILANVERRLKENEFVKINKVFDPMTKGVMPETEAVEHINNAYDLAKQKGIIQVPTADVTTAPSDSATTSSSPSTSDDQQTATGSNAPEVGLTIFVNLYSPVDW